METTSTPVDNASPNSEVAPAPPSNFSIYNLLGIDTARYQEKSFAQYRENIALMGMAELRYHANQVHVPSWEHKTLMLDALEEEFLRHNPMQKAEAYELARERRDAALASPSYEEQWAVMVDTGGTDHREAWARARKRARESGLTLLEQAELHAGRGA